MNEGLLLVRLVFGLIMVAHGAQKLFGWFRGYGIAGTGGFLETLGFRPGKLFAFAAGFSEFAGGLLTALGFLGPIGPALILSVMIVAGLTVHWKNGLFAQNGGVELTLLYAAFAVGIAFTGFGAFSLDALFGIAASPIVTLIVLIVGAIGGFANAGLRRPQVTAAAQS